MATLILGALIHVEATQIRNYDKQQFQILIQKVNSVQVSADEADSNAQDAASAASNAESSAQDAVDAINSR